MEIQEELREQELTGVIPDTDKLAKFRAQVAVEKLMPRNKMSDAALEKLRAQKDQDKADAIVNERFKNALGSIVVTPENLRALLIRIQPKGFINPETGEFVPFGFLNDKGEFEAHLNLPNHGWLDGAYKYHTASEFLSVEEQLERMSWKLNWWIAAGYLFGREIDEIGLINFFSNLTLMECCMSDKEFFANWDMESAAKRKQSRINREVIDKDPEPEKPVKPVKPPVIRLCRAGKGCMRIKARKPAPCEGKSAYCCPMCMQSDKARSKRALAKSPIAAETPSSAN
jgi:hypothetical protein